MVAARSVRLLAAAAVAAVALTVVVVAETAAANDSLESSAPVTVMNRASQSEPVVVAAKTQARAPYGDRRQDSDPERALLVAWVAVALMATAVASSRRTRGVDHGFLVVRAASRVATRRGPPQLLCC